jgi:hypothetical protein
MSKRKASQSPISSVSNPLVKRQLFQIPESATIHGKSFTCLPLACSFGPIGNCEWCLVKNLNLNQRVLEFKEPIKLGEFVPSSKHVDPTLCEPYCSAKQFVLNSDGAIQTNTYEFKCKFMYSGSVGRMPEYVYFEAGVSYADSRDGKILFIRLETKDDERFTLMIYREVSEPMSLEDALIHIEERAKEANEIGFKPARLYLCEKVFGSKEMETDLVQAGIVKAVPRVSGHVEGKVETKIELSPEGYSNRTTVRMGPRFVSAPVLSNLPPPPPTFYVKGNVFIMTHNKDGKHINTCEIRSSDCSSDDGKE